jgi:hypothetical protein
MISSHRTIGFPTVAASVTPKVRDALLCCKVERERSRAEPVPLFGSAGSHVHGSFPVETKCGQRSRLGSPAGLNFRSRNSKPQLSATAHVTELVL